MEVHGLAVGIGQNEGGPDSPLRTNGPKQVGPFVSSIARGPRSRAGVGSEAGERALLADGGVVLEPDLKGFAAGMVGQCPAHQRGEVFLNVSWSASSACGWCGRSDRRVKLSWWSRRPT